MDLRCDSVDSFRGDSIGDRDNAWRLLGIRNTRVGRILGLGSCRKLISHPLACVPGFGAHDVIAEKKWQSRSDKFRTQSTRISPCSLQYIPDKERCAGGYLRPLFCRTRNVGLHRVASCDFCVHFHWFWPLLQTHEGDAQGQGGALTVFARICPVFGSIGSNHLQLLRNRGDFFADHYRHFPGKAIGSGHFLL